MSGSDAVIVKRGVLPRCQAVRLLDADPIVWTMAEQATLEMERALLGLAHLGLYIGYGLYYGAFQGAASALVADLVPAELRGTAYGLFNAAIGVAAFPANVLAGLLWDWYGPPAAFLAGGALAFIAAVGLLAIVPRLPR